MIQNEIEQFIKPTIEDMGYELWGCEYLPGKNHALLRIYIDKADGIGITDCEQVSHQISALLDVENPISANYSLEVSSPGIPRPLFYSHQYQRFIGQGVDIKLFKPVASKRKHSGVIVAADETSLVLNIENVQHNFLFSNIVKACLSSLKSK